MRILNITTRVSSQLFYGACPCVCWRETFPYVASVNTCSRCIAWTSRRSTAMLRRAAEPRPFRLYVFTSGQRGAFSNQFSRQRRGSIKLIFGPAIFNRHVLVLGTTALFHSSTL